MYKMVKYALAIETSQVFCFSGQLLTFLQINFVWTDAAVCDQEHDVDTVFHLYVLLTA